MRLTELRPCDSCGRKIAPSFYVVRVSTAIVAPAAARVLGLAEAMGGLHAIKIAEALSPDTDDAVVVFGEHDRRLQTELLLCTTCAVLGEISIAHLVERRNTAAEAAAKREEGAADGAATVAASEGSSASSSPSSRLSPRDGPAEV